MLIKQKTAACDTLAPQAPSALWEITKAPPLACESAAGHDMGV